jgi:nucleotide-binding universal stress UspA family protein
MSDRITDVFIGTTLGPESDTVVESGVELARALRARVHLVHALAPNPSVAEREERVRRVGAQARRLGLAAPELAGIVLESRPPHRLLLEAGCRPAAMIVIGSRQTPGILSRFAGSTTERVAGRAACPVAVLRGALHLPPERVLVACDPDVTRSPNLASSFELLDAIDPGRVAQTVALATISRLRRAGGPSYWSKTDRRALAALLTGVAHCPGAAGRRLTHQVAAGRRLASILDRARILQPDLLLVVRPDGAGLQAGFERWRTKQLLHRVSGSLLVLPGGQRALKHRADKAAPATVAAVS